MRILVAVALLAAVPLADRGAAQAPASPRLYVLDGGVLESDPARYRLRADEVKTTQLSIAAYLVVHPRGTLLWDTGAIPDDSWTPTGGPVVRRLVLSNAAPRQVTVRAPILAQLAAAGYQPAGITYLALSHYHWDHVANANAFAAATWLVSRVEREAMLPAPPREPPQPSAFAGLQNTKFVTLPAGDHDVFGDGTVVVKPSPGHTPGHLVLYVRLAKTGGVVLSGDLYHYPEERTLNRLPVADASEADTKRSREQLDAFLTTTGAKLWIQHDLLAHNQLRKAPQYYD
jgi:glyoxylase-like metal-dependent hydrolase (beta-lactamase superfamily II)